MKIQAEQSWLEVALYTATRKFVRSNGLVIPLGANKLKHSTTETAAEAINIMLAIGQPTVNQLQHH